MANRGSYTEIKARCAGKGFWQNPCLRRRLQPGFYWTSMAAVLSLLVASCGCAPIANLHFDVPSVESLVMWPSAKSCNCAGACEADGQCVDEAEPDNESIGVQLAAYSSGLAQTAAGTMLSAVGTAVGTAGAAVGSVANYFVPVSAIAPPDVPPPGRFHPVPTTPVFAPRYSQLSV